MAEETDTKILELVHCHQFLLGRFGPPCLGLKWELEVLHYQMHNGYLPSPFFGANHPIFILDNIY